MKVLNTYIVAYEKCTAPTSIAILFQTISDEYFIKYDFYGEERFEPIKRKIAEGLIQ